MTTDGESGNLTKERPPSGRAALLGLAALFLAPALGAAWLYYSGGWQPSGHTNHGELVLPAKPLAEAPLLQLDGTPTPPALFAGKWTLLYIDDGACATPQCRKALWTLRQTRLLLTADMDRVQRVFVAETGCCDRAFLASEHPDLKVLAPPATRAADQAWIAGFPREAGVPYVFIIDPLGNLMMRFDLRQNPKGLKDDLKKLLKLYRTG